MPQVGGDRPDATATVGDAGAAGLSEHVGAKPRELSLFDDLSPRQIVPILTDRDTYYASESAFYRILRKRGLLHHRARSRPPTSRPRALTATGPDQVYSWDITYLRSRVRGVYFYLYRSSISGVAASSAGPSTTSNRVNSLRTLSKEFVQTIQGVIISSGCIRTTAPR